MCLFEMHICILVSLRCLHVKQMVLLVRLICLLERHICILVRLRCLSRRQVGLTRKTICFIWRHLSLTRMQMCISKRHMCLTRGMRKNLYIIDGVSVCLSQILRLGPKGLCGAS